MILTLFLYYVSQKTLSLLTEDTYPPAEDTLPSERRHLRDRQTFLSGDDTMLSLLSVNAIKKMPVNSR